MSNGERWKYIPPSRFSNDYPPIVQSPEGREYTLANIEKILSPLVFGDKTQILFLNILYHFGEIMKNRYPFEANISID